jgi:WD40 repeat protein
MDYHILFSYKGHSNSEYKLDSCLSHDDACVVSGSEDGRVCFWDLVEVIFFLANILAIQYSHISKMYMIITWYNVMYNVLYIPKVQWYSF